MPGLPAAPLDDGGAGDGDHRSTAYLIIVGLVVLLVAIVAIVATTLTRSETASSAEQSQAAKLRELPIWWTVRTGDTYQSIARKTGLTVDELETFNPYVNPDTIQPGQRLQLRLKVPRGKPKPPGPRFYTARSGDTFSSIAQRTGHSMLRLLAINPKISPSALRPGDRVRLRSSPSGTR